MSAARDTWTAYATRVGLLRRTPDTTARAGAGNKYHARRTQVDGIWFASQKEAARYQELRYLERAGRLDQLERQPVFPLAMRPLYRPRGPIATVGRFTADFRYRDLATGEIVVEDVKSDATRTEAYRLRKRIVEWVHGIAVREL